MRWDGTLKDVDDTCSSQYAYAVPGLIRCSFGFRDRPFRLQLIVIRRNVFSKYVNLNGGSDTGQDCAFDRTFEPPIYSALRLLISVSDMHTFIIISSTQ